MTATTRRVTETNHPYRLVDPEDLVPGLEVVYIDYDRQIDPSFDPKVRGWKIVVDEVRNVEIQGTTTPYVFYHFVIPQSWGEGGVPLEDFTEQFERHPFDGNARYWLPIIQEERQ
jgi:hypothetical protein